MSQQSALPFDGLEESKALRIGKIATKTGLPNIYDDATSALPEIISSWENSLVMLNRDTGSGEGFLLRESQVGGVMAVLAHWTTSNKDANIVMPTGTGKTETMMAIMIIAKCDKVLVVVPSQALRIQTFEKFIELGILPKLEHFPDGIKYPIVGLIEKIPRSRDQIDELVDRSNIVVAIGNSLGQMDDSLRTYLMGKFSHLFVDEAHHVPAPTWDKVKSDFVSRNKPILQFTATPFRNDKKHIGGRTIYTFPLKKAYEEQYFKKINFEAVVELEPSRFDRSIAEKVVDTLALDLQQGYDHLVMARAKNIDRAEKIFELYQDLGGEYHPVLLHSRLKASERRDALTALKDRTSRIVVCVDMLGEGFDLPQLKIAGLHDTHKSLPITMQFVGRFTRSSQNVGDATVVANIVDPKVPEKLENLYSQDADWNALLEVHSDTAIGRQRELSEFLDGFDYIDDEFSIQNIRPKMSAMVYRIPEECEWRPAELNDAMLAKSNAEYVSEPAINGEDGVYIQIRGQKSSVSWGRERHLQSMEWHLYVFYWSREHQLLFVNSSSNDSSYNDLAAALAGRELSLIKDDNVFRSFHNMKRVIFHNVGLNNTWGASIRYTMFTGIDVESALDPRTIGTRVKSNIFGLGYEGGERASCGCSYKGRIWSKTNGTIKDFIEWCDKLGEKLNDVSIDPHECVLAGSLRREELTELPDVVPIGVEWQETFYRGDGPAIKVSLDGQKCELWQTSLIVSEQDQDGKIQFCLQGDAFGSQYSLSYDLTDEGVKCVYSLEEGPRLMLEQSGVSIPVEEFCSKFHPIFRLADGSALEGNILASPRENITHSFDSESFEVWDWEELGVNLRKESRGEEEDPESIQQAVIQRLMEDQNFDLIFDDDGAGEAADVIAVKKEGNRIKVYLYHCKFSSNSIPGARITDLYEVCGQAMKSINWQVKARGLFEHMERRLRTTVRSNRLVRGDFEIIRNYRNLAEKVMPVDAFVTIIQPGLSKGRVSVQQLDLLGGVEVYLHETYQIPLNVVCSA